MDEECWRQALSKLDLERDCSTSDGSCWLCDELENWNTVLNFLRLNLIEWKAGKLQLQTQSGCPSEGLTKLSVLDNRNFFLIWLLKKHSCIEAICLREGYSHPCLTAIPDSTTPRGSNLRQISITGNATFDWAFVLSLLSNIEQLEALDVKNEVKVSKTLASRLAQILTANASTVKRVAVSEIIASCLSSSSLMCAISKCHTLQHLTLGFGLHPVGLTYLRSLLRSTQELRTLHLVEGISCDGCTRESDKGDDILLESLSLESLNHHPFEDPFRKILPELESNKVLTTLIITGWDMEPMQIGASMGALLKSVLSKNESICSLILKHCYIDSVGAQQIADGLRSNETLECLDVSQCDLKSSRVQVLCSSLQQNTSLRLLKIGVYKATSRQREALSVDLARNQWYGRVQVRWIDADTEGLCSAMLDPFLCPTELQLHTNEFSESSFEALCSALSSSHYVKDLTVYLWNITSARVTSLSKMLAQNVSLSTLALHDGYKQQGFAVMATQGISLNKSLTDLALVCSEISTESAEMLATLLKTNQTLHKLALSCESGLTSESLDAISRGLQKNFFITEVSVGHITPLIRSAVLRNESFLQRAVSFVLGNDMGKSCAEAFELLESKASLISSLKSISGMTETEAKAALQIARKFIRSNYLFINRIVCQRLECYGGNGTQIDKLNFECWVQITKYLKVSDVCD